MNFLLVCGVFALSVYHTNASHRLNAASAIGRIKSEPHSTKMQLCKSLYLSDAKDDMVPKTVLKTSLGLSTQRFQQTYGGLEVVGGSITVDIDSVHGYTGVVNGELILELSEDIPNPEACEQPEDVITAIAFKDAGADAKDVEKFTVKKNIYGKKDGSVVLTYEVNFFFHNVDGKPSSPCYFIDACKLTVVHHFNNIQHMNIPQVHDCPDDGTTTTPEPTTVEEPDQCDDETTPTSTDLPDTPTPTDLPDTPTPTDLPDTTAESTVRTTGPSDNPTTPSPSSCADPSRGFGGNLKIGKFEYGVVPLCLNTTVDGSSCVLENDYVKVVDLKQSTNRNSRVASSFTCADGYDDEINGAYSPVLDAMYYGTKSARMFIEWYSITALNFKPVLFVHYGSEYENAFWDGSSLTFGDGKNFFYPLVNQDVVSHELAHGVTNQNSDLIYDDQSGGINEAFSDITGEATEMFARQSNDWLVGSEIFKSNNGALRYYEDPTVDGRSIKHTDDYNDNVNVHYSSGIFNHAFYRMVFVNSMPIRQAFECFLRANVMYWTRTTTFEQGACGVLKSCYDLGYKFQTVTTSFTVVGITFSACPENSYMVEISTSTTLPGIKVSTSGMPVFKITSSQQFTLTTTSTASITLTLYSDLALGSVVASGVNTLTHTSSVPLYLQLSTSSIVDVEVSLGVVI